MKEKRWRFACIAVVMFVAGSRTAFAVEESRGGAATPAVQAAGETPASAAQQDAVTEQVRQLRELVYKQQEQINKFQGLSSTGQPSLTDEQRQFILETIKKEMDSQPKMPDWVNNTKISGDFRFRTEYLKQQKTRAQNDASVSLNPATARGALQPDRTRQRIRVRLGFFTKVNDEVDVGIQFATGETADPISTNQTLGGGGFPSEEKKPVWFDLAFADYHPKAVPDLHVIMGRMVNPFYKVPTSELIWDDDLRFEGMAAKWSKKLADNLTFFTNGGGFWLNERSVNPSADTSMFGIQGYLTLALPQVTKGAYVTGGVSYYDYSNLENYPATTLFSGNGYGNTTAPFTNVNGVAPVASYFSDFNIVNPFVEVGFDDPWFGKPIKLFGDIADNPGARSKNDRLVPNNNISQRGNIANDFAWLAGVTYGELKNPKDWMVGYQFCSVQPDAVVGDFAGSDPAGGGTDYKGSKVFFMYQIAKNWQAAVTYMRDDVNRADYNRGYYDYNRLQFDLIFKF